jgi:DNA-binding CsgD family transcriptional regulator
LVSCAILRLHLCELELRAGELDAVVQVLQEWAESSDGELLAATQHQRCRALLAAMRGSPNEAERLAAESIGQAEADGNTWDVLEARRAQGIAALLVHEPGRAAESLGVVWEHAQREGVEEPGAFPVAADLVEALVESGRPDEARAVLERLRVLAEEQEHPWGRATVKRCLGLVALRSSSYEDRAATWLAEAAAEYARMGLHFDQARSLLALGRAQRRHRKWGAARASLDESARLFDGIGSYGWAEEARSELSRISARKPRQAGELTPTERRVAQLAAEGCSNKEIARLLVVSVDTVETHLSRVYAKLGVRSRAQVAGRLARQA